MEFFNIWTFLLVYQKLKQGFKGKVMEDKGKLLMPLIAFWIYNFRGWQQKSSKPYTEGNAPDWKVCDRTSRDQLHTWKIEEAWLPDSATSSLAKIPLLESLNYHVCHSLLTCPIPTLYLVQLRCAKGHSLS